MHASVAEKMRDLWLRRRLSVSAKNFEARAIVETDCTSIK
jgi:hypothetical protein